MNNDKSDTVVSEGELAKAFAKPLGLKEQAESLVGKYLNGDLSLLDELPQVRFEGEEPLCGVLFMTALRREVMKREATIADLRKQIRTTKEASQEQAHFKLLVGRLETDLKRMEEAVQALETDIEEMEKDHKQELASLTRQLQESKEETRVAKAALRVLSTPTTTAVTPRRGNALSAVGPDVFWMAEKWTLSDFSDRPRNIGADEVIELGKIGSNLFRDRADQLKYFSYRLVMRWNPENGKSNIVSSDKAKRKDEYGFKVIDLYDSLVQLKRVLPRGAANTLLKSISIPRIAHPTEGVIVGTHGMLYKEPNTNETRAAVKDKFDRDSWLRANVVYPVLRGIDDVPRYEPEREIIHPTAYLREHVPGLTDPEPHKLLFNGTRIACFQLEAKAFPLVRNHNIQFIELDSLYNQYHDKLRNHSILLRGGPMHWNQGQVVIRKGNASGKGRSVILCKETLVSLENPELI